MTRLDHIGIAVQSIAQAAGVYRALGIGVHHTEAVPEQGVTVASMPLGDTELELLEPLGAESAVARFIERRGEGIHHLCIAVPDIVAALEALKAEGAHLINPQPVRGAGGSLVAFVHPKSAHGVLVELKQAAPACAGTPAQEV
ncbi:MAG: methylmalonyl-CoA epimerase [Chloroflexota bacterium]